MKKDYKKYTYWTMADGKNIEFKDMEYSHLCNTISLIEKSNLEPPALMVSEMYRKERKNIKIPNW